MQPIHSSTTLSLLYTAEQTRALDACAINDFDIPGFTLMSRAATAVFKVIQERWPTLNNMAVMCGKGNNGGDGFLVACLAHKAGIKVTLYHVGELEALTGDAQLACEQARREGVEMQPISQFLENPKQGEEWDLIVDALLGTGLHSEVKDRFKESIQLINHLHKPVVAVDIPSGLSADTGAVLGCAIKASATVSFIGLKQGLLTGQAPDYVGALYFDGLEVPSDVYEQVPNSAQLINQSKISNWLPQRQRTGHKGSYGHTLIVGGNDGMVGAAMMASEAAARIGSGLVTVATRAEHVGLFNSRLPEIMVHPCETVDQLKPLMDKATVVAVGPGLGQDDWSSSILQAVLEANKPLLLDADALNLIATDRVYMPDIDLRHWVVTPHPGEAARILKVPTATVQADRFASVQKLQNFCGGVAVLKGAGTLIFDGQQLALSPFGNPGMATGGMGDVLSGVIAGLMAQGLTTAVAAQLGVMVHGLAGDLAAEEGERGMLATDLMPFLRQIVNQQVIKSEY